MGGSIFGYRGRGDVCVLKLSYPWLRALYVHVDFLRAIAYAVLRKKDEGNSVFTLG